MTPPSFLDTNIILRHVLSDHPDLSPKATAVIRRIEHGELTVRLTDTVVFEAVFTLEKFYRVPRPQTRQALEPIIALAAVILPDKEKYGTVFELFVERRALSFADCFHIVTAQRLGLAAFITLDRAVGRAVGSMWVDPTT